MSNRGIIKAQIAYVIAHLSITKSHVFLKKFSDKGSVLKA